MKSKRQAVIVTGRLRYFAWQKEGVSPSPLTINCECLQFISANPVQQNPPDCADTSGGKSKMPPESGPAK